jgi:hypothetical protein
MIVYLPDLPAGWALAHIILLDPEWQVAIKDDEHLAIGTGDTPDLACMAAIDNVAHEHFAGRLYIAQDFSNPPPNLKSVLEGMGVLRKRDPAPWIDL